MAAKKNAKKTTDPSSEVSAKAVAPAAKKAAKKTVAKKAVAKKAVKSPAAKAPKAVATAPSPDAVARAAYLIYRHRIENGLPGDSHNDWLQAEQQLSVTG